MIIYVLAIFKIAIDDTIKAEVKALPMNGIVQIPALAQQNVLASAVMKAGYTVETFGQD